MARAVMMTEIPPSDITPEARYLSRRQFIRGLGVAAGGVLFVRCAPTGTPSPEAIITTHTQMTAAAPTTVPLTTPPPAVDELGNRLTSYQAITNYCNYYEFTFDKEGVARLAADLQLSPWQVEVGGLVHKPRVFDLDDLRRFEQEERIYRMRCVEGWSKVVPWFGFSLARLLRAVEPMANAQYVRFETLYDPAQMPGQKARSYPWPYAEGLRMDEAMNDLSLLATGLYGQPLLPQNGAPVRLVVPWKYGFKSIKSIVKIDLVEKMPISLWMAVAPEEYGFFANVNPEVDHPRWSQSTERFVGETGRQPTLFLNGYADQVARLYQAMDLTRWF